MEIKIIVNLDGETVAYFKRKLETIEHMLGEIKKQGEQQMSAMDDLNTAIKAEDGLLVAQQAVITKVAADVDTLKAAIGTGAATPQQIADALTAIQSHVATLGTSNQALVDADTKANA